ncbi:IclR family transcriptional regulator domain-containing protein [Acuticoccus kandeliae]|uniref:IclR family transcriptional regulator domain-containing protein n=1 Tax=Acuticoccus kandeliae TaxID=2073160 RepID=UPI000D3E1899|nr:IclR family transcriptional regulator C-terminal domain-containing protein [Acuticoccus kandeliae]
MNLSTGSSRPIAAATPASGRPRTAVAAARDETGAGSLAKGLAVLSLLSRTQGGLRLSDVATELSFARATARRALLQLCELGYARQEGRLFYATPRVVALAVGQLGAHNPWEAAMPVLTALSREIDESVSIGILDGTDVCYVARAATRKILSISLSVGSRLPAAHTSMGRVLLAGLDEAGRARVLSQCDLAPPTPHAAPNMAAILERIEAGARAGYVIVDQELEHGLRSVAVPIRDAQGRVVAALNVGTSAANHSTEALAERFVPRLRRAADEIGHIMSRAAA